MDADLIIIGGGLAGLTTANRALELGLRPIVLEKGKEADYPCNSRYSGGLFHVAFKDVTKPVEDIEAAKRRRETLFRLILAVTMFKTLCQRTLPKLLPG